MAKSGPMGVRVLATDAIDAQAESFYHRFSFATVAEGYPCRMILDLRPLLPFC